MPRSAKRHVQPEDLFLLKSVTDPQISPDGKRVAYCVAWPDKDSNETRVTVHIAPTDGSIPTRRFMHEIGGTPQENPEEYAFRSPISYMGNVETPVMLIHHEGDLRCPIGQSEEIFHALKARGKKVEFVRYPGGFHTYNTHAPSQIVDRTRRTKDWYESHAPGTARPKPRLREGVPAFAHEARD